MGIESCAIVFVQHAKSYEPYALFSRRWQQPAPDYVWRFGLESMIRKHGKRVIVNNLQRDREREALHRLFYQGRWLEMVDHSLEQPSRTTATAFEFETAERIRESYDAFESGQLMFGGIYEAQDLAEGVASSAVLFSTVADRGLGLCNSFRYPRRTRKLQRRSSV